MLAGGTVVGHVTSGNFSPVLCHGIALGFVPPTLEPGAAVAIDVRGTHLPGLVVRTDGFTLGQAELDYGVQTGAGGFNPFARATAWSSGAWKW